MYNCIVQEWEVFIISSNLIIKAFEDKDMESLHAWLNEEESVAMVGRTFITLQEVQNHVQNKRNNDDKMFAFLNSEDELIGWGHLSHIEPFHGRAEIGILLAPNYRGRGYGYHAMSLLIDIGFNKLRLHRIYLTTRGINKNALKLYKKLGFVLEGTLREHGFINGQYHDTYYMGILSHEWKNRS